MKRKEYLWDKAIVYLSRTKLSEKELQKIVEETLKVNIPKNDSIDNYIITKKQFPCSVTLKYSSEYNDYYEIQIRYQDKRTLVTADMEVKADD